MSWFNLRQLFKSRGSTPRFQHLDRLLVRSVRTRRFPRLRQLKYLGQFLTPGERRIVRGALALATLATLALVIITAKHHVAGGPRDGGDYSEAVVGHPTYLNPLFAGANDVDSDLTGLIYAGLFAKDSAGKIIPFVAKNFTISPDGKIYNVELRDDVRWSDNEPLTANDVALTLELIQNPEVGSPLASAFAGVRLEKLDDYHVRFVLPRPFGFFLSALTVGLLPEHLWGDIAPSAVKLAGLNLQPVGAGPWAVGKFAKDDAGNVPSYVLRRNEYFFGPHPYLNTLTFKFVGDYTAALDALRGQTVLAVSFVPRAATKKLGNKNIASFPFSLPQYTALFFNPGQESALKNIDLRRALALAISKTDLIHNALDDGADSIDGPILPASPLYQAPTNTLAYDSDAANALLNKTWTRLEPEEYFKLRQRQLAGALTSTIATTTSSLASSTESAATLRQEMSANQTFYRQDKDGQILMLTITTADTPEYHAVAETLANQWRAIGVKTATRFVPPRLLAREVIKPRDYQILLYGEILGSDPDLFPFWHSSQSDAPGLNLARYSNHDADRLLEDARTTTDEAKRAELYKKFQTLLRQDLPAIFLYTPRHLMLISNALRGVDLGMPATPADRYANLAKWYLKTRWTWKW